MLKFKRLVCVMASVLFVGMTLGGCALFQTDVRYDNGQIVAKVGNSIQITKKELVDAYNNFGYQYVQQFDYSRKQAFNTTLDTLVDREIAIRESVRLFGDLSDYEKSKAQKNAYDYMERNFKSIEKTIRDQRKWSDTGKKDEGETHDDHDHEHGTNYEKHEPYIIQNGSTWHTVNGDNYTTTGYVMNLEKYHKYEPIDLPIKTNDAFIEYLKMPRGNTETEIAIANETYSRMVRYLSNREQGVGQTFKGKTHNGKWEFKNVEYDTDKEKRAVIEREINRVRIEEEKNILQSRLNECFEWGIRDGLQTTPIMRWEEVLNPETNRLEIQTYEVEVNAYNYLQELLRKTDYSEFDRIVSANNQAYVDGLAQRAIEDFRNKLRVARVRYDSGFDKDSGFNGKLLESLADLYFVPEDIAKQYFTVSHILVGFSDEQKAELESIETLYKQGAYSISDRDEKIEQLRRETTVPQYNVRRAESGELFIKGDDRCEGEALREMEVGKVLDFVNEYVMPNNPDVALETKQKRFRDMIYMFNTDPGMQNPEFEYVIGIDTRDEDNRDYRKPNGEIVYRTSENNADNMSKMVKEFTFASRELYGWDYKRGFCPVDTRGTMSGLVWTEYGAHIIMYTRNINDFIFTGDYSSINDALERYINKTMTSYGEKTYFDKSLESVTKNDYSAWEKSILNNYKGGKEIKLYRYRYKDLTKD